MCVWYDFHDIISFEILICNQTLNTDWYSQQLQRVPENLPRIYIYICVCVCVVKKQQKIDIIPERSDVIKMYSDGA